MTIEKAAALAMRRCRNFFETGYIDGTFTIENGAFTDAPDTVWYCIQGSRYNNGVHKFTEEQDEVVTALKDETFTGRVWLLCPPPEFLDLAAQIGEYADTYKPSAYSSEAFGGYSRTGLHGAHGLVSWEEAYAMRLNPWQKMFTEVG